MTSLILDLDSSSCEGYNPGNNRTFNRTALRPGASTKAVFMTIGRALTSL